MKRKSLQNGAGRVGRLAWLLLFPLLSCAGAASVKGQSAGSGSAAAPVGVEYNNAYGEGLELYERKDYHGAAESFRRAGRLNPQDADAFYNEGCALGQLNRLREAVVAYRRAVGLRPGHAKAQSNLCYTLVRSGRNWEALDACRQAVRLSPENPSPYHNLGLAHAALGRHEGAVIAFNLAVRLRPDFRDAHFHSGLSLRAAGDYKAALEVFTRLGRAAASPQDAELGRAVRETLSRMDALAHGASTGAAPASLLENVADAYRVVGRHADSAALYRVLLARAPGEFALHNKLGLALYSLNHYGAAAESLRRAVALKPDSSEALANLTWLYYVMGEEEAAVKAFKALDGSHKEAARLLLNNVTDAALRRRLLRPDDAAPALSGVSRPEAPKDITARP
ncbi:MAG TPA: tetratricopeptide repeat protein [Pyrinomonadaceae bacterium]|nr:tetratricopeptide repeat protein [Pyrinomonadaceae bacterium]